MFDKYKFIYQPNNSIIHSLNPTIKLICYLIFLISSFFKYNYVLLILMTVIISIYILFSNIHIKYYLKAIIKLLLFFLIIGLISYKFSYDYQKIIIILYKMFLNCLYLLVILYTTSNDKVSNILISILNYINIFGIEKAKISNFTKKIITKLYFVFSSTDEVLVSNALYGKDYTYQNAINKKKIILESRSSIKKINEEKYNQYQEEMKYKLYNEDKKKYSYRNKIRIIDIVILCLHFSLVVFYILRVR